MAEEKRDTRGGRFEMKNGQRVCVNNGTQDHKKGNRARDKDGVPIGTNGMPEKSSAISKSKKSEVIRGT